MTTSKKPALAAQPAPLAPRMAETLTPVHKEIEMPVQYDPTSRPHIQANHIDGPLLFLRDGRLHWLTWRERLQLWLGRTDAYKLERKWWNAA